MTTPRSILYDVHRSINELKNLFKPDRDDDLENEGLFEKVDEILRQNRELLLKLDLIADNLSLIVNLLGKSGL